MEAAAGSVEVRGHVVWRGQRDESGASFGVGQLAAEAGGVVEGGREQEAAAVVQHGPVLVMAVGVADERVEQEVAHEELGAGGDGVGEIGGGWHLHLASGQHIQHQFGCVERGPAEVPLVWVSARIAGVGRVLGQQLVAVGEAGGAVLNPARDDAAAKPIR